VNPFSVVAEGSWLPGRLSYRHSRLPSRKTLEGDRLPIFDKVETIGDDSQDIDLVFLAKTGNAGDWWITGQSCTVVAMRRPSSHLKRLTTLFSGPDREVPHCVLVASSAYIVPTEASPLHVLSTNFILLSKNCPGNGVSTLHSDPESLAQWSWTCVVAQAKISPSQLFPCSASASLPCSHPCPCPCLNPGPGVQRLDLQTGAGQH